MAILLNFVLRSVWILVVIGIAHTAFADDPRSGPRLLGAAQEIDFDIATGRLALAR